MMHFAYPNIGRDPKDNTKLYFIGCGRYLSLLPEQVPNNTYTLANPQQDFADVCSVQSAACFLARELWASTARKALVYETRDQSSPRYHGHSLELAYLLAFIRCARPLRLEQTGLSGDIWCTGTITCVADKPRLYSVSTPEFDLKLKHFLGQSQDRIFLVPAPNLLQHHRLLCEDHHVPLRPLAECPSDMAAWVLGGLEGDKVVIPIMPDELSELVRLLFTAPSAPDPALDMWSVSRVMVQSYPYPAEECLQVLREQILPTLRFRSTLGLLGSKKRIPTGVMELELRDFHRPTLRLDVRLRTRVLKVRSPVVLGPRLRLYCTAVNRYLCTVHCEAESFKMSTQEWLNQLNIILVRFNPARFGLKLLFKHLPSASLPSVFLDDESIYTYQQVVEEPDAWVNATGFERICQVIFHKIHARLAQVLAGTPQ